MRLQGTLLVVEDVLLSRRFYEELLDEELLFDLGANQQFKSGLTLQSRTSMIELFGFSGAELQRPGHSAELYYETEEFARFLQKLHNTPGIVYVHGAKDPVQYEWGQRAVRFYDPDGHMIEVGESMDDVIRRFLAQGLTPEDIAACTELPLTHIQKFV